MVLRDEDLETIPKGSKTSVLDLVLGVARHDIYHVGQIQLLKLKRLFMLMPLWHWFVSIQENW